ncbi:MAG: hypothetical protein JHC98_00290 [Thermoleophilaceae bacterium]|nr:hypothetical protein [Thermoleophilaceae bacterium]
MDWRRPIEQQVPVAPSASERPEPVISFIDSDEYRRAAGDPEMIEFAIQARVLRESLLHERPSD